MQGNAQYHLECLHIKLVDPIRSVSKSNASESEGLLQWPPKAHLAWMQGEAGASAFADPQPHGQLPGKRVTSRIAIRGQHKAFCLHITLTLWTCSLAGKVVIP